MRLIDADALIDDIQRYANEPIKLNDRRWDTKCVAIIMDMIGTVKSQPTIEAEPVKHGRWAAESEGWGYTCSECQNGVTWRSDYCPACGAKMDLEVADED